jgi:hypothetical protein
MLKLVVLVCLAISTRATQKRSSEESVEGAASRIFKRVKTVGSEESGGSSLIEGVESIMSSLAGESASRRVVDFLPARQTPPLQPRSKLASLVKTFLDVRGDEKVPGPFMHLNKEILLDSGDRNSHVFLMIGTRMSRQLFSTIFEASLSAATYLIKYQVNCEELGKGDREDRIHPLVREAAIHSVIADSNIAMKMIYLSGGSKFQLPLTEKSEFLIISPPHSGQACLNHPASSVRFLLVERARHSLNALLLQDEFRRGVGLGKAIKMTLELLALLEDLHAKDIVHGDIHPGNVVVDSSGAIKLIDFGMAFFNSDMMGKPEIIQKPHSYSHVLYSHYNILGSRFGFRDDLFKALHVLATLMMGVDFMAHCASLDKLGLLFKFKAEENYFAIPGRDPVTETVLLSPESRALVRGHLNAAMEMARNQPFVDKPARLTEVSFQLALALEIVNRFSP